MTTFTEKHYYDFVADNIANTLRSNGAKCGGGSEVLVVQPIVLESNQNHATITDNGICPTLSASMGMGGGYIPMILVTSNDNVFVRQLQPNDRGGNNVHDPKPSGR